MTIAFIIVAFLLMASAFILAAYCLETIRKVVNRFEDAQNRRFSEFRESAEVYQGQIESLVTAIARQANLHVIFPRRGPLEPSDGWFDGKPKIIKVTSDATNIKVGDR